MKDSLDLQHSTRFILFSESNLGTIVKTKIYYKKKKQGIPNVTTLSLLLE